MLIDHVTEDGTYPVRQVMQAKEILDNERLAHPERYPDSVYKKQLSDIKAGTLKSGKIGTLTVIIKATDDATYKNMVDALDEMTICSIGKYVLDKINPDDEKLLKLKGVH